MMRKLFYKILVTCFLLTLITPNSQAQSGELVFFGGMSNYLGDLQQKPISLPNAQGVVGLTYKHPLNEHFWVRGAFANGKLYAWDGNNEDDLKIRNLSFESRVLDGYVAGEYRLFTEEKSSVIPYVFAGVGMFHFDPYVRYGDKNEKVYLQPLGTEGQGLPEYPDRKPYKLTEFMIPLGGGILWHINEKWMVGAEFRFNYTFTDYLDDVSTRYALPGPLLRDNGPLAVELAWRRDELDGRPYPNNQSIRGNPDINDMYYYAGFQIGFKLGSSGGWDSGSKRGKSQVSCPKW